MNIENEIESAIESALDSAIESESLKSRLFIFDCFPPEITERKYIGITDEFCNFTDLLFH